MTSSLEPPVHRSKEDDQSKSRCSMIYKAMNCYGRKPLGHATQKTKNKYLFRPQLLNPSGRSASFGQLETKKVLAFWVAYLRSGSSVGH